MATRRALASMLMVVAGCGDGSGHETVEAGSPHAEASSSVDATATKHARDAGAEAAPAHSADSGVMRATPDAGEPADAPSEDARAFLLGWYEGASCTCSAGNGGPGNIDTFASWLGSPITIGSDYAAIGAADAGAASWNNWAFPGWQSTGWQSWGQAHPGHRLVYAPGLGVAEDMAGGAQGAYDAYWKTLGESLVSAGFPGAIIRIAHEFNGNWYWYQPAGQTAAFIGYWQHAVTAMRSAAGQDFKFFWNPSLGVSTENGQPFDCEDAYPGDAYVDYIGPDTYDDDWGIYPTSGTITAAMQTQVWQGIVTGDHGLNWFVTFAAQHGKPLAIAEWGVWAEGSGHGGGDDPSYIQNMHDWLLQNHVAFADYFDADSNAIYPGSPFPLSLAAFKQLF